MSGSDIFRRIAAEERSFRSQNFVAPYSPKTKYAIVPMRKMYYRFRIRGTSGGGMGEFKPISPNCADYVGDAPFDKARVYLNALHRVQMILSYQTEDGWIAYPFNAEAASKLGIVGQVLVWNVSDAQRFDAITVRYDGANFWYDEIFAGSDPEKADKLRELFAQTKKMTIAPAKGITPENVAAFETACQAWTWFNKKSEEDSIKDMLEAGGARLHSFVVRSKNIELTWFSESGRQYHSLVQKGSLNVVSAGICLSGEDAKFHLKDLPHVIAEGERRSLIVVTRHH